MREELGSGGSGAQLRAPSGGYFIQCDDCGFLITEAAIEDGFLDDDAYCAKWLRALVAAAGEKRKAENRAQTSDPESHAAMGERRDV